jgi:hypothetical protein
VTTKVAENGPKYLIHLSVIPRIFCGEYGFLEVGAKLIFALRITVRQWAITRIAPTNASRVLVARPSWPRNREKRPL